MPQLGRIVKLRTGSNVAQGPQARPGHYRSSQGSHPVSAGEAPAVLAECPDYGEQIAQVGEARLWTSGLALTVQTLSFAQVLEQGIAIGAKRNDRPVATDPAYGARAETKHEFL